MVIRKNICFALAILFCSSFAFALDASDFSVDNAILKMVVGPGGTIEKTLSVRSQIDGDYFIDQGDLSFLTVEQNFYLNKGETKKLNLLFDSANLPPGIYFGELEISNGVSISVPIIFEVESSEVLFDGSLSVPLEYSAVGPGDNFVIENKIFNLENIGLKNIDAYYFVQDFEGNVLFSEDENLAVETQNLNTKSISIPKDIPSGDYLFGVILRYGDSVGTSTHFFRISEDEKPAIDGTRDENYFLYFVVILLICLIFFIVYYLHQRDKVFLELNRQYRNELIKQKCSKAKPREVRKRIVAVKKIYKERVKKLRKLKHSRKKSDVDLQLDRWRREGYNVDEFLIKRKKISLKDKIKGLKKEGYKL